VDKKTWQVNFPGKEISRRMRKATITRPDKSTVRAPSGLFLVFVKNVL